MDVICWRCKSEVNENDDYCRFCGAYQGFDMSVKEEESDRISLRGLPWYFRIDCYFHEKGWVKRFRILKRFCDWVDDRMVGKNDKRHD